MSYILEALKKSEQEREHGGVPGLQTDHRFHFVDDRRKPWWKYAFILIISVNLVLVATLFYTEKFDVVVSDNQPEKNKVKDSGIQAKAIAEKPEKPVVSRAVGSHTAVPQTTVSQTTVPQAIVSQTTKPPQQKKTAMSKQPDSIPGKTMTEDLLVAGKAVEQSVVKQVATIPEPVTVQDESIIAESATSSKPAVPEHPGKAVEQKSMDKQVQKKIVPVINETPTKSIASIAKNGSVAEPKPDSRKIVRISQLPDAVQHILPDLKYSGHLYSSNPSRRKLIVNGRSMQEGEWVNDDLQLDEITIDGAVFAYKEYYYQVELLRNWSVN